MTLNVVHTEASTGWGGQELRILTEMEGMARRGHRLHLVAPANAQIVAAARARGLSVEALPIEWKRLPGLVAMRRWLARRGAEFDVINAHSSTDAWLAALACARLPKSPALVRTRHLSTPVNRLPTTRWLYQRATSHLVVTGEALKTRLVHHNGYDPATITSVRTGIDLARFRPQERAAMRAQCGVDARPSVGIVATLRDWKGHDDLLEAWRELKASVPGWQLLVIGDGPRRAHLERRVRELNLDADVRFTGNRDDVPAWLACLEIAVLPSYGDEGVPQSLMQAAACGLPSVSTPVGAIAEAVINGETGLLVPPRDPRALARALATLMNDRALRERMGRAARAYAQTHFGLDAMLDAMEAIFDRAAARDR
ncbi:MAG: glycosyltransferase family 4 protein [Pseudomonadota bacterium]|nr:glycosyltransferase family 4 protein [Pseudomonadota bacterium]